MTKNNEYLTLDELLESEEFQREFEEIKQAPTSNINNSVYDNGRYPEHQEIKIQV